ncbi:oligosaccharyltransferase complex subunit OSTC-like [Pteronotus mesoamericanus]|uniref:oligosaccharyltransferase complex subunit OSTC-like n=1 Tax=Pteronotus mesoamericanus TaxID=1884717 RepID=UPI0023EDB7AF|nr:oligosaccharyltransferase complex subunit OSTC-like [Pteronotus parnellii mesoamericanus]
MVETKAMPLMNFQFAGEGWSQNRRFKRKRKHRSRAALATTYVETLCQVPLLVLQCPNLTLKKLPWVNMPSAMTVYFLVVVSYFLISGGIVYNVIVEPPSVDSMTDKHGNKRPVAFSAY